MRETVKMPVDLEGQAATLIQSGPVEVLDEGDGRYTISGPDLIGEGVTRDHLIALQTILNDLLPTIA